MGTYLFSAHKMFKYLLTGRLSKVLLGGEDCCRVSLAHLGLGILSDSLLEKVGLTIYRDELHPVKGISGVVDLLASNSLDETVGTEFDVLGHRVRIHTNELHGQSVLYKLAFDLNRLGNNLTHTRLGQLIDEL